MDDKKILTLLWNRAETAIEALAQRYGLRLYQTARNILRYHEDAEESVNDTYMAIWCAIPPKKPEPLAGFVYKIGRNTALKHLRANTALKRNCSYDISLSELENAIAGADLWEQLDAKALGQAMDRFLDTISLESRMIFLRRYWFGDSVQDISGSFHLSENAVSVRLSRTRDKLKAYLIKEGFLL